RFAPRFVIDASGQAAVIGRARGFRQFDDFFKNLAIFGYFRGAERLPGELANHILSAAFADGWFWYIPLHDGTMSVGAVVDARRWRALADGDPEGTYRGLIARCPAIAERLARATLVSPIRIIRDYSYTSTRFTGPGFLLAGDAACFIDPVFSTGVHLACLAGFLGARAVDGVLAGAAPEPLALGRGHPLGTPERRAGERSLPRARDERAHRPARALARRVLTCASSSSRPTRSGAPTRWRRSARATSPPPRPGPDTRCTFSTSASATTLPPRCARRSPRTAPRRSASRSATSTTAPTPTRCPTCPTTTRWSRRAARRATRPSSSAARPSPPCRRTPWRPCTSPTAWSARARAPSQRCSRAWPWARARAGSPASPSGT